MRLKSMPLGIIEANAHLFWDPQTKQAIIVDVGGEPEKVISLLQEKQLDLKYIVLTHGHCDHIAGAVALKTATGAQICVHEADQEMLEDPDKNSSNRFPMPPVSFKADLLLKDNDTLQIANETVKFIHTPGHTRGGMCVLIGDYLATGDTLFQGSIGRTDLYGGNMQVLNKSLSKLAALPHQLIVLPGHGPQTTLREEMRQNPYMMRSTRS